MVTFFTSIGCMDGRILPVVEKLGKETFEAEYVDTITEPGFVGFLAREAQNPEFLNDFKNKLFISTMQHLSKGIIVFGHEECAGNPVSDDQQRREIRQSIGFIRELVGDSTPVIGIFVRKDSKESAKWLAEVVS
jgi:hypothetical protein